MAERIVLVSHAAPRGEDTASRHLAARGFEVEWSTPALGGTLPEPEEAYAGAVVYGGPQPLTETARHPYLKDEMDWIGRWLAGAKPLLAICLGAQLLAHHLGARVAPHPDGLHEFGFYPLIPTPAGRALFGDGLRVMQIHHHGFDLPRGATHLARSGAFPHQAFSWRARGPFPTRPFPGARAPSGSSSTPRRRPRSSPPGTPCCPSFSRRPAPIRAPAKRPICAATARPWPPGSKASSTDCSAPPGAIARGSVSDAAGLEEPREERV
jgi:GMP synthase-like glutamine amidotransferase